MALFSSKKESKAKPAPKKVKAVKDKAEKKIQPKAASSKALADSRLETLLKAPWMSEKALIGTERGVYVFDVTRAATKPEIKKAVERIYKVVPVKVTITNLPGKTKALRSKRGVGTRAARRKASVYLKKGDSIQF